MKPTFLLLNGSLSGENGNTTALLRRAVSVLHSHGEVLSLTLSAEVSFAEVEPALARATALVIGTGTYWDSWSHLLQRFLEDATASEGTSLWLGKPAGVLVTMHSVGGKGVLSRLQGVLNTFGCMIPPMSGMVFSHVGQAALASDAEGLPDLWCREDVDVICHNLVAALEPSPHYRAWPVDRGDAKARWIEESA